MIQWGNETQIISSFFTKMIEFQIIINKNDKLYIFIYIFFIAHTFMLFFISLCCFDSNLSSTKVTTSLCKNELKWCTKKLKLFLFGSSEKSSKLTCTTKIKFVFLFPSFSRYWLPSVTGCCVELGVSPIHSSKNHRNPSQNHWLEPDKLQR